MSLKFLDSAKSPIETSKPEAKPNESDRTKDESKLEAPSDNKAENDFENMKKLRDNLESQSKTGDKNKVEKDGKRAKAGHGEDKTNLPRMPPEPELKNVEKVYNPRETLKEEGATNNKKNKPEQEILHEPESERLKEPAVPDSSKLTGKKTDQGPKTGNQDKEIRAEKATSAPGAPKPDKSEKITKMEEIPAAEDKVEAIDDKMDEASENVEKQKIRAWLAKNLEKPAGKTGASRALNATENVPPPPPPMTETATEAEPTAAEAFEYKKPVNITEASESTGNATSTEKIKSKKHGNGWVIFLVVIGVLCVVAGLVALMYHNRKKISSRFGY